MVDILEMLSKLEFDDLVRVESDRGKLFGVFCGNTAKSMKLLIEDGSTKHVRKETISSIEVVDPKDLGKIGPGVVAHLIERRLNSVLRRDGQFCDITARYLENRIDIKTYSGSLKIRGTEIESEKGYVAKEYVIDEKLIVSKGVRLEVDGEGINYEAIEEIVGMVYRADAVSKVTVWNYKDELVKILESVTLCPEDMGIGNIIAVETAHGGSVGIVVKKTKKCIVILTTEDEEIELENEDITRIQYAKRKQLEGDCRLSIRFFSELLRQEVERAAECFGDSKVGVVLENEVITIVSKDIQVRLLHGDFELSFGGKVYTNLDGLVEVSAGRRGFLYSDLREISKNTAVSCCVVHRQENESYSDEYKKAMERIESLEKEVEAYKEALRHALRG